LTDISEKLAASIIRIMRPDNIVQHPRRQPSTEYVFKACCLGTGQSSFGDYIASNDMKLPGGPEENPIRPSVIVASHREELHAQHFDAAAKL
jgi:hypothetical protein